MTIQISLKTRVSSAGKRNRDQPRLHLVHPLDQLHKRNGISQVDGVADVQWLSTKMTALQASDGQVTLTREHLDHEGPAAVVQVPDSVTERADAVEQLELHLVFDHTLTSLGQKDLQNLVWNIRCNVTRQKNPSHRRRLGLVQQERLQRWIQPKLVVGSLEWAKPSGHSQLPC